MLKKLSFYVCLVAALFTFAACSKKESGDMKSMEQIHEEDGFPVVTRTMAPSVFKTFLKYPATFIARSESTAKAKISEVVRTIHAKLGDTVAKDDVIVTFSQDNASYQQAKSNFANAEATYKRMQQLFASNGVSQQNLDNAKTQYEVARANFKLIDDNVNVKAPIGGIITRIDVRVTENVSDGTVLFTVSNLDTIEARIWVSAKDIGFIQTDVPVVTEWLGETISGKVTQVNMIMDTGKKAFLVLADFPNKKHLLTSGMTMDVSLQTYINEAALQVHRKELVTENNVTYVYLSVGDTAQKHEVLIGKQQGLLLEIIQGLKPGDVLISEGSQMVQDGNKVYSVEALAGSVRTN
jgi:RND family efflux transporter MFP subunit